MIQRCKHLFIKTEPDSSNPGEAGNNVKTTDVTTCFPDKD